MHFFFDELAALTGQDSLFDGDNKAKFFIEISRDDLCHHLAGMLPA